MDFHGLHRRDLQSLCKLNKIPANMTNVAMANALHALSVVEGLDSFAESRQGTPLKAPGGRSTAAAGNNSRAGSSIRRTLRGTAKTVIKKDNESSEGGEMPNSPTTLSARGRRTRTVVMYNGDPTEEDDGKKAPRTGTAVPDLVKTPAPRPTRAKKSADLEQKSSIREKDGAGDEEAIRTPAASTRRTTRATSALPKGTSAAKTSRYSTRKSSRRATAAEEEAPAKEMKKGDDMPSENGSVAGEEGSEAGQASPAPERKTAVELFATEVEAVISPDQASCAPSEGTTNQTAVEASITQAMDNVSEEFIDPTDEIVAEEDKFEADPTSGGSNGPENQTAVSSGSTNQTVEEDSDSLDSIEIKMKGEVDPTVHGLEGTAVAGDGDSVFSAGDISSEREPTEETLMPEGAHAEAIEEELVAGAIAAEVLPDAEEEFVETEVAGVESSEEREHCGGAVAAETVPPAGSEPEKMGIEVADDDKKLTVPELGDGVMVAEELPAAGVESEEKRATAHDEEEDDDTVMPEEELVSGIVAEDLPVAGAEPAKEQEGTVVESSAVEDENIAPLANALAPAGKFSVLPAATEHPTTATVATAADDDKPTMVLLAAGEPEMKESVPVPAQMLPDDKENNEACRSRRKEEKLQKETLEFHSLRKLKAAVKEKLQAIEEKKKRAALAAIDDNCFLSPGGRLQC